MFAWMAGGLASRLWRRSARLALAWPACSAGRWAGVAAALAYAVFSGWGVPSQRTVCMLCVAAAAQALGLRWPWWLVLLGAAAVVAWLDPWAVLQVGFWLSFAAVALLMSSSPVQEPPEAQTRPGLLRAVVRTAKEGARTQGIATLGLAPLTLVCFQQLSVVGFAANLVAIPLVTLLVTPLALLGVACPPLWLAGAWLVRLLAGFLGWLTSLPGAVWTVPAAPVWAQACGLLAGALWLVPLPRRMRLLALPMACPMLWPAVPSPPAGRFELVAADVGQGTAVLVKTSSHQLLFDTGPQYSRESDAGERVLLPLLRLRGTLPVDLLVLSHSDLDHVGGASSLLSGWPVRALSSSLPQAHPLLSRGVRHTRCEAGARWQWDGVNFRVLSPPASAYAERPDAPRPIKPNWLSCVIRVEDTEGHSALLTGDAETPQEKAMVAAEGAGLHADVLVVPHHGSKTSSSEAFLDAVRPRVAIVQAAYRSRFGHPAPEVMARYEDRGIAVVRSDRCGAFTWSSQGMRCEREAVRRYWHFVE